jgi:general secretion pathway protein E
MLLADSKFETLDAWSHESFATALGDLLIARGRLDETGLDRARRLAAESGAKLDAVLTQLGLVSDRAVAEAFAELLGLPIMAPGDYPAEPVLAERLRPKFLRKARALPVAVKDGALRVAMADPLDRFAISAIRVASGSRVEPVIAVPIDLEAALDRLYSEKEPGAQDLDDIGAGGAVEDDAERLKDLASEAPLIRLVNQLISQAVETRASDIHIEPFEDRLRIRYRYDGVLHEVEAPPRRLQLAVVSRIKIMAMLDIAERRLPQDGRIKIVVRGHEVDLRVSTIPALHGESVVLRILDRSAVNLDFAKLGMDDALRSRLGRLLDLPNGIILVTGPTGSGKTTTLYTALLQLNSVDRNIITVEDPIEYQLPGINQVQVKPLIGLNFASLLRAILRHDPDVIMIGEIRDIETAQIAVQASLTGHLVLSTIHTNSAAATIARLRDMGLEDYLLTATINGIMAQRLVRRLCPACKRPSSASADLAARFDLARFIADDPIVLYEPGGCKACRDTGYIGRIAIAELLTLDDSIRRLILSRADQGAIQTAACQAGMQTMFETGLRQVAAGNTSLAEILRSIRADD